MANSVFISYSRADKAQVVPIQGVLERAGVSVNIDECSLRPGDDIKTELRELIRSSDHVICFLSKNSLGSFWVLWEIRDLIETEDHKRFMPAYLDTTFLDEAFATILLSDIDKQLDVINEQVAIRTRDNSGFEDLAKASTRLNTIKNNLPSTIARLKELNVVSLAGNNYTNGASQLYRHITGKPLKDGELSTLKEDEVDNSSYTYRVSEVLTLVADKELEEAATKAMSLLKEFCNSNRELVIRATILKSQISTQLGFYSDNKKNNGHGDIQVYMDTYEYVEKLLNLIPEEPCLAND